MSMDESIELFEKLNLTPQLLQNLKSSLIKKPNDLQRTLILLLNNNRDKNIYIKSRPQSGKKTAFLIHTIHRIDPNLRATQAIIITPTAELVYYISETARNLTYQMNIRVSDSAENLELSRKTNDHLVVTTLGSFLFMLSQQLVDLDSLKFLIFDELDLLMNSDKKIRNTTSIVELIKKLQRTPQVLLFSNTYCNKTMYIMKSIGVRGLLIRKILRKPLSPAFQQYYCPADGPVRKRQLIKLLQHTIKLKVVLYSLNAVEAHSLAEFLRDEQNDFRIIHITSYTTIRDRLEAIYQFNSSKVKTIFCTHYPIGHGLFLHNVGMVINFDLPAYNDHLPVEYWHRISKCNTTNNTPSFIVNLMNRDAEPKLDRLQKYFNSEMTELEIPFAN